MKYLSASSRRHDVWVWLGSLCVVGAALHLNAAGTALQNAHRGGVLRESTVGPKQVNAPSPERIEYSASRQRIAGRETAGFSARQALAAHEEKLTSPAGLKAVEAEAWLAMARRHEGGGTELGTFYPARYGEAFVVEGQGMRVAVRPVGGSDVAAQIENGQVIYRQAYPATDSVHVVSGGRGGEFFFFERGRAPGEFAFEISAVSVGTRAEVINSEERVINAGGAGGEN